MFKQIVIVSAVLALTACGGGGGDSDDVSTSNNSGGSSTTNPGTGNADTEPATDIPASTYGATQEGSAYIYLNTARLTCGANALTQNSSLDKAAAARALDKANGGNAVPSEFSYVANYGYTASSLIDFGATIDASLFTSSEAGTAVMKSLISSPNYTRNLFAGLPDVGFGSATSADGKTRYLQGYAGTTSAISSSNDLLTYPCEGLTDVPTTMALGFSTPGAQITAGTTGPAIMLKVPGVYSASASINITRSLITDAAGNEIATRPILNNSADFTVLPDVSFIIPSSPLKKDATYKVVIEGSYVASSTSSSVNFTKKFSFTTEK